MNGSDHKNAIFPHVWSHVWGKMANNGFLIVKFISQYPFVCRLTIVMSNDSVYYACLSYVGFKICEIIKNDLIQ